jgi:HlyD family secretion protein
MGKVKSIRPAIIIIIIVLLLLAGGGWWTWRTYYTGKTGAIQATGTIEGTDVNLSAKNSGTIQTLTVNEGDAVVQGQVVAVLSRNDLVAQRDQDALAVTTAQANLDNLVSGARAQEIAEGQASVNIAQANYNKAVDDLARNQPLYQSGAVSKEVLDQSQTAVEVDKGQLDSAQAAFSLLQAGNRPDAIAAAQDEVKQSQAVLQSAQAVLNDLNVVSPINGTVLTKNYEQGEFVQMGSPIVTLVNLDDLWIRVYIPTDQLPSIKLGQQVLFTVSGLQKVFAGTVEEINSQGEFTLKTIQTEEERANVVFGVKIKIDKEGGVLKPGMPADVTFE